MFYVLSFTVIHLRSWDFKKSFWCLTESDVKIRKICIESYGALMNMLVDKYLKYIKILLNVVLSDTKRLLLPYFLIVYFQAE